MNTIPRRAAALLVTLACGEATAPPVREPMGVPFAVSSCDQCAGTILAWQGTRDGNDEIYTAAPDGTGPVNVTNHAGSDRGPAISPDGRSIAFSSDRAGTFDIWVMDVDGANPRRLTSGPDAELAPAWSPDGTRLAFVNGSPSGFTIHLVTADGASTSALVTAPGLNAAPDWSPDGHRIAFHSDRTGNYDVWVADLPTGTETRLTTDAATDGYPAWSPDGQSIAFASTRRSGEWDLYTMSATGADVRALTSDAAVEASPDWSPDGTQLAFERFASPVTPAGEIYSLRLDGSGATNVTNHAADDRAPSWSTLAIPALDVGIPGIRVLLVYEDLDWQSGARPSATGASYWIEARLVNDRDARARPIELGQVHDEVSAYHLADASYQLHLTYGPGSSSAAGLSLGADLTTPVSIRARNDRTVVDSVNLTDALGVIEGTVTVNGAAPGTGFSACVLMGAWRSSDPTFDWCLPLAAGGMFRLLLPANPGTLAICRTTDVNAGACERADIEAGGALATVPISVHSGRTRTIDPIDVRVPGVVVNLRYRDESWSVPDVPSATGAAYWIEGALDTDREPLRSLGRINDSTASYGMPPGAYEVRLFYGPVAGGVRRPTTRGDLVPGVGVFVDGLTTLAVTVDISATVGVVELPVTVNGGPAGPGYAACVAVPGASGSETFRWCLPIPDDGLLRLMLPGDGTGQICLAHEASGTECTEGSSTARGPLANFAFRVRAGRTSQLDPVNLTLRNVALTLEYRDRDWTAPARPGATGAEYWIQGRLEPRFPTRGTVDLGRIQDVTDVLALVGSVYDLRLSYGPQQASSTRISRTPPDLVPPVPVSLGAAGQTAVTVDITRAVGGIEGAFTFNGAQPGEGYAFCMTMGQATTHAAFDWCPTLPADGSIRFLLPEGRGTGTVCRAADVVGSKCVVTPTKPAVATVAFDVRAGETRNISSDLRTP